jgi:leucyl aminopeptidase (aminopeptidase T)
MRFALFVLLLVPTLALAQPPEKTPAQIAEERAAAEKAKADKLRADQAAAKKAADEKAKAEQKAAKEAAEKLKARQTRPDNDTLAARLTDAAAIHENDIVLIRGSSHDSDLLDDIAIAVRKRGAFPILHTPSERLARRLHEDLPKDAESQIDPVEAQLAAMVTAIISIDSDDNPTLLNHISPARLAVASRAQNALDQLMFRRNVRRVSLGRGLYPTASTANRYALTVDELDRAFWYACSAEERPMRDAGDAVYSQLSSGNQVAITGPNGTDVKFKIEKRPVYINDGTISPEEAKAGGARCLAWLPAGEAYCAILPGTAEGKIVCDSLTYRGHEVQNLTITFKAGKLNTITARSGLDLLRKDYDAAGPANSAKNDLSALDIGLNPDITIPHGVKPLCAPLSGMVTLTIGNNLWAGGDNAEPYQLQLYLPGCTVTVDKEPLVKDGVLSPTPAIPVPLITP